MCKINISLDVYIYYVAKKDSFCTAKSNRAWMNCHTGFCCLLSLDVIIVFVPLFIYCNHRRKEQNIVGLINFGNGSASVSVFLSIYLSISHMERLRVFFHKAECGSETLSQTPPLNSDWPIIAGQRVGCGVIQSDVKLSYCYHSRVDYFFIHL